MNRLTEHLSDGNVRKISDPHSFVDVLNRLAAYEDTGLEPEEVRAMKTAYGKNQLPYLSVGDEVFRLRGRNYAEYIERGQVDEIRICKKSGTHIYVRYEACGMFYTLNEFQKYVCLTRKEAEARLKEAKEGGKNDG